MPLHDFVCPKGHVSEEMVQSVDSSPVCSCGAAMKWKPAFPMLNMWSVDYSQMDGEKEAIDAGMYE